MTIDHKDLRPGWYWATWIEHRDDGFTVVHLGKLPKKGLVAWAHGGGIYQIDVFEFHSEIPQPKEPT